MTDAGLFGNQRLQTMDLFSLPQPIRDQGFQWLAGDDYLRRTVSESRDVQQDQQQEVHATLWEEPGRRFDPLSKLQSRCAA